MAGRLIVLLISCVVFGCVDFCLEYTQEMKCTRCLPDFINKNGKCVYFKTEFLNCGSTNGEICTSCLPGYYLSQENTCHSVDGKCKEYDEYDGECLSCYAGYYVRNNTCTPCSSHCLECSSDSCLQCEAKYYVYDGYCRRSCNAKCQLVNSDKSCQMCEFGYGLDTTGRCKKCSVTKCSDCVFKNICTLCSENYILKNNTCVTFVTLPYCIEYSYDYIDCISCQNGYKIENGRCTKCPANCEQCGKTCDRCDLGYYLDTNENSAIQNVRCVKCPLLKNCKYCLGKESCEICEDKYHVDDVTFECIPNVQFCILYNNTKCVLCDVGHYLLNDKCIDGVQHCDTHFALNKCVTCEEGYFASSQLQCAQCSTNCETCEGANSYCTSCGKGMIGFNSSCALCEDNKCDKCTLDGEKCYECVSNGYEIKDNKCQQCSVGCYQCSGNGKCLQCNEPYYLEPYFGKDGGCVLNLTKRPKNVIPVFIISVIAVFVAVLAVSVLLMIVIIQQKKKRTEKPSDEK